MASLSQDDGCEMWLLSDIFMAFIVIFLYQPKMYNIAFRRQRHGLFRNAYNLNNTKGERTRGDVEKLESAV